MTINNTYEIGDIVDVLVDLTNGYPLNDNKNVVTHTGRIMGITIDYHGIHYKVLINGDFYSHIEILGLNTKTNPTLIYDNEIGAISYFGLSKIIEKSTGTEYSVLANGENALDITNTFTKEIKEITSRELISNYEYKFDIELEILKD